LNGGAIQVEDRVSPNLEQGPHSVVITHSAFDRNTAKFFGGAIAHDSILRVLNSTFKRSISENAAAIAVNKTLANESHIENVTFDSNEAVSHSDAIGSTVAVGNQRALVEIKSSILSQSVHGFCSSLIVGSRNDNLFTDTSCNLVLQNDNLVVDVGFANQGVLRDYGGKTPSIALLTTSRALDHYDCSLPDDDQREFVRPARLRCDSGAFELGVREGFDPAVDAPPPAQD
jgi:hypothetical protein